MRALGEFNTLDAVESTERLLECCASPAWAAKVAAGRPYGTAADLRAAAAAAFDGLDESELALAHDAHPRIGERAENAWSRAEQSQARTADEDVQAALVEANRAYERRFGRVFLIRASGRSAEEILAEARRRLGNDPETEAAEATAQLREIVLLRLDQAVQA